MVFFFFNIVVVNTVSKERVREEGEPSVCTLIILKFRVFCSWLILELTAAIYNLRSGSTSFVSTVEVVIPQMLYFGWEFLSTKKLLLYFFIFFLSFYLEKIP